MTALASIFTLNTLRKDENTKLILIGLTVCVLTFYFKDLSLALGQTERISMAQQYSPIIALSFFAFIGVLQINENKTLIIIIFLFSTFLKAENISIESKITLDKKSELSIFEEDVLYNF